MIELEHLDEVRLGALDRLVSNNEKVSKAYNKYVKPKVFEQVQIVWKTILPL